MIKLRDYQHDLLNRVRNALDSGQDTRAMLQLPTGGGKTRIGGRALNVRESNKAALDKLAPQIWESRVFRG